MTKLTIDQILNLTPLQVRRTSEGALRSYTQTLADAMNKRVKRMLADEYGENSEFIQDLRAAGRIGGNGPAYTLEGKTTRAEVKAFFDELRINYKAKGRTTVSGIKKNIRKVEKRVGMPKGVHMTPKQAGNFWKAYRTIEADYGGSFPGSFGSTDVQKMLVKAKYEDDWTDAIQEVEEKLGEAYEEQEKTERAQSRDFPEFLSEADDLYSGDDGELPF